jgi:hypothetical protein
MSKQSQALIQQTERWIEGLDIVLDRMKKAVSHKGAIDPKDPIKRASRERLLAIEKIQEAVSWLGLDIEDLNSNDQYHATQTDDDKPHRSR